VDNHITIEEQADENLLVVNVPFNADFNYEMKEAIPYERRHPNQGRGWTGEEWIFSLEDKDIIEQLVAKHFPKPRYSVEWV
jgi:hypothetical protein